MAASLQDFRSMGRSGLVVSPLCLGTMGFGDPHRLGMEEAEAVHILDRYLELGGNFIDTANIYASGESEAIIGRHLGRASSRRNRAVIATKFSNNMYPGDPNAGGAGRKAIVSACEDSLKRLQTDYIDLYWMHWEDPFVPVEETMRALDDLVRSGKLLYVGFSDTSAWKTAKAQTSALFNGWTPLAALQFEYSLLARSVEGEILPMAADYGFGTTPWSPLAGGMLSGKYRRDHVKPTSPGRKDRIERLATEQTFALLDLLHTIAERQQSSAGAVAIAWLLRQPLVTSPIIGPRTVAQLDQNLAALQVELTTEDCEQLNRLTRPTLNFPAPFLKGAHGRSYADLTVNNRHFPRP